MNPFRAPFPQLQNQVRAEGQTKSCGLQQSPISNSTSNSNGMCNNQPPCPSQQHPMNPTQFPVQSNNPYFMNVANQFQLPMQNLQMGFLPQAQFFPQNNLSQLQGFLQSNNLQNQFASLQPQPQFFPNMPGGQFNFQQHPLLANQMTGLPHGQFPQQNIGFPQLNQFNPMGYSNQGALPQGSQNPLFLMNPQQGMANTQGQNMYIPSTMGQNAIQGLQQLQRNDSQVQSNLQSGAVGKLQENPAKNTQNDVSSVDQKIPQGQNFTRVLQESSNREPRNKRFQKSNFHPMTNANGNSRFFKGRGPNDKRARNAHLTNCTKLETSTSSPSSKSIALNYTEEEIQKWREERRKNHPSKSNSEKKSGDGTHSEIDSDAQKRRQQLKEILAKQAELGIEVAEIPREYLLDSGNQVNGTSKEPENQVSESAQNRNFTEKGKFKKRGRKRGGANRFNKKQKSGNSDSSPRPVLVKKKPTLLQKLLSKDIKRDKSHLLQAFRFMVLNNFFVDWQNKPLEFPLAILKDDTRPGSETGKEASPHLASGDVSVITEKDMVASQERDILHDDVSERRDVENEVLKAEETCNIQKVDSEKEGEITDSEEEEEEEGEITD